MRYVTRTIEIVVIIMMAVVTLTIISEVAARTFFSTSLIISEELSRYLMIWTAMLAAALVAAEDGHIRINMFTDKLGPRMSLIVSMVSDVAVIAFLAVLTITSILQLPRMANQGTVTLGINMAWIYAAMPVGGALAIFFVSHRCWVRLSGTRSHKEFQP